MRVNEYIPQDEEDAGVQEDAPLDPETLPTMHVYPMKGGLLFLPDSVVSQELDTEIPLTKHTPTPAKEPSFFPQLILILCFFVLFDMADSQLTALLAPIATITITPQVQPLATTATVPMGSLQGRVLPVLTLTQSQTTQATGKGHRDARAAVGTLTFYNGLFTVQSIPKGTMFVGQDGVKVATAESVTIPAANPPQFAEVSVSAYAVKAGSSGNIGAGDINNTIANGILVKNSPFAGGQDARDFISVTKADIQHSVDSLIPHLLQSEQVALTTQLAEGEALVPPICTPVTTADHGPGSEATTVQVTVSASCPGVAYNQQAVQAKALQLLTSMAATQLGAGYTLIGAIHVTVAWVTVTKNVVFSFACTGMWVYTLTPQQQQQIKHLIAGRTKQDALQLLLSLPGIHKVIIAGIGDNEMLPDDVTRIHLFTIVEG